MGKEAPFEVENCRGIVRVFSDGSIIRSDESPFKVPIQDDGSVVWKDVTFDHSFSLQLRIYWPSSLSKSEKLPVYIYFHGGGFCFGSRTWPNFHNFCLRLAASLRVVVVAPDQRHAPENPLPAPIDDAFLAVRWVQAELRQKNSAFGLIDFADPKWIYISGDSSGGTITHNLAVGLAGQDISPLCIRGYVLIMPGFIGEKKTPSEMSCPRNAHLTLELYQRFGRLALPRGTTEDHPILNPFGPNSKQLGPVKLAPMLVVIAGCDFLRDRHLAYVKKLQELGKEVEMVMFEGKQHSFHYFDPKAVNELMACIMKFIAATRAKACEPIRSLL